jgi:ADP-ribose pyrophosphatase YjhB (NUDIX family)
LIQRVYRYLLFPALLAYYRVFRPTTHGVKVVIEDEGSRDILLVRHCYGDREVWHVPGGAYRPRWESPERAARREIREELSLQVGTLVHLGEYRTDKLGNRDTVQIFSTTMRDPVVRTGPEIEEYRWAPRRTALETLPTYGVTKHALRLLDSR